LGASPLRLPCCGWVTMKYVKLLSSRSDPLNVIALGVSSAVVTDCGLATGASLTAAISTFTVMVSVALPSDTCTTKLSVPLKFASGT